MTYHDYQVYTKNRQHMIELRQKGKRVLIPKKVKPVKPEVKIGYLELKSIKA